MRWCRVVQVFQEVAVSGLLRLLQIIVVVSALVGGGRALWRNKDRVKQTWRSLGGMSGVQGSASTLIESIGPMGGFLRQLATLKR